VGIEFCLAIIWTPLGVNDKGLQILQLAGIFQQNNELVKPS
jgi:hypothetical protein